MIRVLHVNSSLYAGGVAEILVSLVNQFGSGYECTRLVVDRPEMFFDVSKKMHNDLHGCECVFTDVEQALYHTHFVNDCVGMERYDAIIIHDPQPLPLIQVIRSTSWGKRAVVIWRCHIPCCSDSQSWQDMMLPYVNMCDGAVFTMQEYIPQGIKVPCRVFTPCIDEYALKNIPLTGRFRTRLLKDLDIRSPYILQISRFDKLKGVHELVDTYTSLAEQHKDYDFVLASNLASDDPEGMDIYHELTDRYIPDNVKILLLADEVNLNKLQVNALQSNAALVLLNSIEEGFGLVVTEAMWKRRCVLARDVGGISKQITHGVDGLLMSKDQQLYDALSDALATLEENQDHIRKLGKAARATVKQRFLMNTLASNYRSFIGTLRMRRSTSNGTCA